VNSLDLLKKGGAVHFTVIIVIRKEKENDVHLALVFKLLKH
jgi:hypothetical protein